MLSPEEVTQPIDAARNLYYRTLLMTLYPTAVRRSELCRLKVDDIDSQRMIIRIHQGKGRRDRDLPLSPKLLETLCLYWRWRKPKTYLFPGRGLRTDVPSSANMIWLACRQAAQQAGIRKRLSPTVCADKTWIASFPLSSFSSTLRDSFAVSQVSTYPPRFPA